MTFKQGDRIKLSVELKTEKYFWSKNVIVAIQAVDEKRLKYQIDNHWFDSEYIEQSGQQI